MRRDELKQWFATRVWMLAALTAITMSTTPLPAQTLRGRVLDRATQAPVPGAIVSLLADSTRRWPVLTDSAGAFTLRADAAGSYRVRVDRVGYAPFIQALPLQLDAGAIAERTILVPSSRVELATVRVTTDAACSAPGIRGEDAARVWEQVRTALSSASLTAQQALIPLELTIEERIARGPDARRYGVRAIRRPTQVWRTRSPRTFVCPDDHDFRTRGFRVVVGDSVDYYGPDAEVALSDAFLSTHCFRVVRARGVLGRGRRLGLAFAPLDAVRATFLRGTMWLDESTSRLEQLEFEYAVPEWPPGIRAPRGDIRFDALASGGWIVREWEMTLPVLAGFGIGDIRTPNPRHVATVEKRGRAQVLGADAERPVAPAVVTGIALDSIAGTPFAGAVVRAWGDDALVTDARGAFALRLDNLPPEGGTVALQFEHPLLRRYVAEVTEQVVRVRPGDSVHVAFAGPGPETTLERTCRAADDPPAGTDWGTTKLGVLFLHALRVPSDTVPLKGRVEWDWEQGGDPKFTWVEDTLAADGSFVACPVATDRALTIILSDAAGERLRIGLEPDGRRARAVRVQVPAPR